MKILRLHVPACSSADIMYTPSVFCRGRASGMLLLVLGGSMPSRFIYVYSGRVHILRRMPYISKADVIK